MFRKIGLLIFVVLLSLNLSGCVALLAGAAGGAGTAVWLSGKLSQEANASFEDTIKATKKALLSLRLKVKKETIEANVAQVMSSYTDGKTIWVDIHRISGSTSKIEVRVGVAADKDIARKILNRITKYL